jgi:hypothetical protein
MNLVAKAFNRKEQEAVQEVAKSFRKVGITFVAVENGSCVYEADSDCVEQRCCAKPHFHVCWPRRA